jgi:hypothetical protein
MGLVRKKKQLSNEAATHSGDVDRHDNHAPERVILQFYGLHCKHVRSERKP